MPATAGKRPSCLGHWLTPFSRASRSCAPVRATTQSSSSMGRRLLRSRTRRGPAGSTSSARSVPLFTSAACAPCACPARSISSATQLAPEVSPVRMRAKRKSRSVPAAPTTTSMVLARPSLYSRTMASASRSTGSAASTGTADHSTAGRRGPPSGRAGPSPRVTTTRVSSRKSVPDLITGVPATTRRYTSWSCPPRMRSRPGASLARRSSLGLREWVRATTRSHPRARRKGSSSRAVSA
mmetsp:Transcript_10908/g.37085  ORF Transcript_10908/g.37085 Transcript_10908/m.37085 type:complete len:239 (+) Transcript_10908:150-866(+)